MNVAEATAQGPLRKRVPVWLLVVVLLGVGFRLFHADWKLYGYDETITSIRASGQTIAAFEAFVDDGRGHAIGELKTFQAPARDMDESAVWRSLALEDPQHPPLYFWLTSLEQRALGDSVLLRRLPAIVFGLLCIPAMWWFAYELFRDRTTAWWVGALVAVSPFHVAFSQQAREYTLWIFMTAVSSALLLRALREGQTWTWIAFGTSVALGLWGFALFAQVIAAQALYVLALSGAPPRRRLNALAAIAGAIFTFGPWIAVMVAGAHTATADTAYSATRLSAPLYLGKWIFNAASVFFDLDFVSVAFVPIALVVIAIAASCVAVLVRRTPRNVWGFVVILGGIGLATCLVPDLAFHESRAAENRYLTVAWIALDLATGYGLANGFSAPTNRQPLWRIAATGMFVAGIVSCGVGAFARSWWIATYHKTVPAIGAALFNVPHATIVYSSDNELLLSLLPVSRDDLRFDLHRDLAPQDFRGVGNPFAIAKAQTMNGSRVADRAQRVELPASYLPARDRFIEMLHRRAAGDRMGGTYELEELYRGT